ncbi:MAG: TolC family protein [Lewinellaceae bacterium]|nr:TolC family protein [Lewinellaceae bacterium]
MDNTIAQWKAGLKPGLLSGLMAVAFLSMPAVQWAQAVTLTLGQALQVAERNYPLLKRDLKFIEQQQALIGSAASRPLTGIYISGDEADIQSTKGIYAIALAQNFNWPGSKGRQEQYLKQAAQLGNARLELDQQELRRQVSVAYYEILYAREQQEIARQQLELYTELVELAQLRFDLGETGKIPVLSALGKQKEAALKQQQANQDAEVVLAIFNNWMYSDTLYDVAERRLPAPTGFSNWYVNGGHPLLLYQQQQARVAEARIPVEQARLLPQIRTGAQLQMVDGDSPFYGYQLGLNVPLGQKAIKARIEAAQVEVDIRQSELDAVRRGLENERRRLITSLQREQSTLEYLNKEMLPLANEQIEASRRAYSQGAIEYQDYLTILEQAMGSREQYIEALHRYHLLKLSLELLSGRR